MKKSETRQPSDSPSSSGVVRPHSATLKQRLLARVVCGVERGLMSTLRCEYTGEATVFQEPEVRPVIFCLWHNRLAICMHVFSRFACQRQPEPKLAAMVSASRDGALLSSILKRFKVHAVRGSSSRRGAQAVLEMVRLTKQGFDLAITPDGPRGPRYVAQLGAIWLAQLSGVPLVPVLVDFTSKWDLNSWDQFQIPKPLSRCVIRFAPHIHVPAKMSPDDFERVRLQLQHALMRPAMTFPGDPET